MIAEFLKARWKALDQFWLGPADPQVYAVLRIGFALVALLNLIELWPHRHAFFSNAGIIDLAATRAEISTAPYFSIFYLNDSVTFVTGAFIVSAVAMVLLALGILPRAMIAIVFVWHLSYTYRAFPIVHGWDIILRLTSFFLLVSPLGGTYRLARWLGSETRAVARQVPRYGLALFQLQLAVIYFQTVWLKLNDAYWRGGEFISYFMLSIYSRLPKAFWADQLLLSNALTFGTLAIEVAVPFLLWRERTRVWGFFLGWGLHLGIACLSHIWMFSIVMMMMYLAFLTGPDLARLRSRWAPRNDVLG